MAVLATLSGALPAVFAALVGVLVGQLTQVVRSGLGSPGGHRATVALIEIAVVLIGIELVGGAQEVVSTDLYRRYDGHLLRRVMSAALSRADLKIFDEPELAASLDRAVRVARFGPGELVSGLSAQWTARAQGLAAAVLVGVYRPAAAAVLTVVWLLVARALQTSYYQANPFWTDPLRRARYVQGIGLFPRWAKEVRIFGLADWLIEQYRLEWIAVISQLWQARRADRGVMAGLACLVVTAHVAVLALLAASASSRGPGVGALTVILQGLFGMSMIASMKGDTWIENGAVPLPDVRALERSLRALPPPVGDGTTSGGSADGLPREFISFDHVSFCYPASGELLLDGLNVRIQAGTSLAIVGLNGAGKTTLVKLLSGLCQPTAGTVTVDGTELTRLDLASWRRQLAVIFQDFVRYELPLRDNITFGSVEQSWADTDVARIAERAGIGELLAALPAGASTVLSPRFTGGADLSGGQWQRIAFARALLAVQGGARVLVMDEPTAHLDVRAEAELYASFLNLTRGLTTIVISHRFSTVRRADRIVVLDHGRIIEDGSHLELVKAGGQYERLFRLQARNYTERRDA